MFSQNGITRSLSRSAATSAVLRSQSLAKQFAVSIEESLLVDAPDALERADVEGILRAAVARAFARELTVRRLVGFGFFQRTEPDSRSTPSLPVRAWPPAL
jgi:hypothetical protein